MTSTSAQPNPFLITAAQLTANFCETLFYGIYLVTFAFCARILLVIGSGREERWVRSHEIRWMMLITTVTLFIVCTFDVALGLFHNLHAFVYSTNAEEQFSDLTSWINITKMVNQGITMVIGDYILVYRCWIVYGRRWLIITPSLILYLGNLALIARFFEIVAGLRGNESRVTVAARQFQPWVLAIFGTTAVQTILTTSILIWRIWSVEKQGKFWNRTASTADHQPTSSLRKVIRVIGESGAAYTTSVFVTFVLSALRSNAVYPTSTLTLQMTGIAFNVILIRSSSNRNRQFTVFEDRKQTVNHYDSESANRNRTFADSVIIFRQSAHQDIELTILGLENERLSPRDALPECKSITAAVVNYNPSESY